MCEICENKKEFDAGCITGKIESGSIRFDYLAYSIDSSFSYDDSECKIHYCPFCGVKLKHNT